MMTCQQIIDRRKELWNEHRDIERDRGFRLATAEYILKHEHIRQEIRGHPEYLIEMCFLIVDKDKQNAPFFLNEVQQDFVTRLNKAVAEYRAGRRLFLKFLILKGRQQGFTSFITAYQLSCTITRKNFEGFTAADEDGNTSAIFENKAKHVYNLLPDVIKPSEKYNNRKQLLFEKLHSSWEIKTATKNMGRSRTINFFHGSEAAFWKDGIANTQAGIGEALTKDSIQILESTANGYGEHKDLWDSGEWENCFYEWWRTSEYRMSFESEEAEERFKQQVLSADKKIPTQNDERWVFSRCRWLIETIGLAWDQVYWYYIKWRSYIKKDLIKQEYPCSEEEAFLASGQCVFNQEVIVHRMEYLKRHYQTNKPRKGRFRFEWANPKTQDKIKNETITWVDDPNGSITIYEDVGPRVPYVIGGDTKGEGKDKYAATAINNMTGKRCATLHLQATNSKPYTWQMYCLGIYFNVALIGIEINFNTAPIEELQRLEYPKQYVRQVYDDATKRHLKKYGWKTDGNTRPIIIDKEIALIEDNIELFSDLTFLSECLTFVYDKNGRPDAESGKHDDVLISDMIANEIRSQQSFSLLEETIERKPRSFPFNDPEDREGDYQSW